MTATAGYRVSPSIGAPGGLLTGRWRLRTLSKPLAQAMPLLASTSDRGFPRALDADGRGGAAVLPSGRIVRFSASEPIRLDVGAWYPEFGKSVSTRTLAVPFENGRLTTIFTWA